ncbi:MAG: hypothetical protein ACQESR_22060 [Planctomycetota bacterium]
MESCPTQAVLPLVGLAGTKVIRDRYISGGWILPHGKLPDASRPPVGRTRGHESHPRPVYWGLRHTYKDNDWPWHTLRLKIPASRF